MTQSANQPAATPHVMGLPVLHSQAPLTKAITARDLSNQKQP
jgi:hypothetical protein